ncbi:hypothetical protein [Deinococcus sp.]|uniref:hypothetical protein n=1 Tax=Deinococcus sp. TaxID=47478 RepID=UPI003B58D44D
MTSAMRWPDAPQNPPQLEADFAMQALELAPGDFAPDDFEFDDIEFEAAGEQSLEAELF